MSRFNELDFGPPAAERDSSLEEVFIESDLFRNLCAGRTSVVLGNRGAGKSVLFHMLARRTRARRNQVIELVPEDYSYEMLRSSLADEERGSWAKQGAYAAAWKYMLYVEVMKLVARRDGRSDEAGAARIRRYVRDRHRTSDLGKLDTLISYLKRLEGIKIGPYEAAAKTRELHSLYKLEEIARLIPDIELACRSRPVVILVDELDKGWDASEDARCFASGLFQACLALNRIDGLSVCMTLRQELYDEIPELYEDVQKYRDIVEKIAWGERELLAMIAARIRRSVPKLRNLSDEQVWARFFEYRLPDGTKSFDYVLARTFHRPREVIQFCAEVIQGARRSGTMACIDRERIEQVEHRYSHERLQDTAAEFRFSYPGLASVFEVFRGGPQRLSREELEYTCLRISDGDVGVDRRAEAWVERFDEQGIVEVLWHVGFLQAGVRRSGAPDQEFISRHTFPHAGVRRAEEFRIHPMFAAYLGLAADTPAALGG